VRAADLLGIPGLADAFLVTAAIGTSLRRAGALSGLLVAGLVISTIAAGALVATSVGTALLTIAVRDTALAHPVALVGRGRAAAAGAAPGRAGGAVLAVTPIDGIGADLVEAVATAAVVVLLAGTAIGRARAGPTDSAFAALALPTLLVVALLAVTLLTVALLAAPPHPFVRALGRGLVLTEREQHASERQRRQHGQDPTAGAPGGEGAREGIKSDGVHGDSNNASRRPARTHGRRDSCVTPVKVAADHGAVAASL
jgi:hypothetical protein